MCEMDENLKKILWLVFLLFIFLIMNPVSYWVNGFKLDVVNQWIKIVLIAIFEIAIIYILLHWRDFQ